MKKLISLLVALMLCLTAFAALAELTEPGTLPITTEPAELTIWAAPSVGQDDYDVSKMTKWVEEKTGIKLNFIQVSNVETSTLFNTSVASGEWPDIYMVGMSGPQCLQFSADGVLLPLTDLIEEHGYFLKQAFEKYPLVKQEITAPDGEIYSFPTKRYTYSGSAVNKLWVYEEWLNRYMTETGKEAPDTPDELKDMLLFFRDNDMNGNGDTTDEIMMTGNYNYGHEGGAPQYYILNAFCYIPSFPFQFFYINDENSVTTDVTSEGYREGLRFINDLYKEGLFPEEIFVQDLNTMRSLTSTTKDKVIVATAGAPYSPRLLTASSAENTVTYYDYVPMQPLKNKDGVAVYPTRPDEVVGMRNFITTACDTPELAIRFMDFIYSDEFQTYLAFGGQEGADWEWVESPSFDGDPKSVRSLQTSEDKLKNLWDGNWCGALFQGREHVMSQEAATSDQRASWAAHNLYMANSKLTNVPTLVWCEDEDVSTEFAETQSLFKNYIETAMSEFILGIRDIDSDADWNAYVEQMNKMGLEDFKALAEEYYGIAE